MLKQQGFTQRPINQEKEPFQDQDKAYSPLIERVIELDQRVDNCLLFILFIIFIDLHYIIGWDTKQE